MVPSVFILNWLILCIIFHHLLSLAELFSLFLLFSNGFSTREIIPYTDSRIVFPNVDVATFSYSNPFNDLIVLKTEPTPSGSNLQGSHYSGSLIPPQYLHTHLSSCLFLPPLPPPPHNTQHSSLSGVFQTTFSSQLSLNLDLLLSCYFHMECSIYLSLSSEPEPDHFFLLLELPIYY